MTPTLIFVWGSASTPSVTIQQEKHNVQMMSKYGIIIVQDRITVYKLLVLLQHQFVAEIVSSF